MKLNGSQILLETLLEQGTDTIFGYPGGAALNIYDELYKYSDRIRHVLAAHEQGASHAADGYARATGKVGEPDKRVVHVTGDGSFHMNLQEMCTAVSNNLPVITVVVNNSVLGMVYQWQTSFYGKRYSNTDPHRKTDFVKLAEAFGAKGLRCDTLAGFEACMKEALATTDGPVLIDAHIDKTERVLPFIPGGETVRNVIID